MTQPVIGGISPFFIVRNVPAATLYYCDLLGFSITFQESDDHGPFFAIVRRDHAMIFLKAVGAEPTPNHTRGDTAARWDAYVYVPDPDVLAREFASRGVTFSRPLQDTHDGLRGFELKDADGYVLFFGRPQQTPD
jgi:catechol 2,3-dioxygenase-like lactoylglutathione lyase family enzyme